MEAKTMLEQLAEGIGRVLKAQPTVGRRRTRKMRPEALVAHALGEIQKAATEAPEQATQRLAALGRAVETAKQSFVDTASEEVEVEVFEEETTAAADESEKETSPVALEAALGNSAFAANPEDLQKALARLAKEISGLRGGSATEEPKADTEKVSKAQEAEWPFDMNTKSFREGVEKAEVGPTWGYDPGRAEETAKP